jgi:hypothetical protein
MTHASQNEQTRPTPPETVPLGVDPQRSTQPLRITIAIYVLWFLFLVGSAIEQAL